MQKFFRIVLYLGLIYYPSLQHTQDTCHVFTDSNKTENCREELEKWCQLLKSEYSRNNNIMTWTSYYSISCNGNRNGQFCYKNGKPWFQCDFKENNIFTYSDKATENNNICDAKKFAKNNLCFNKTAFDIEMKELDKELKADEEERKREMKELDEELKADEEERKKEMKELDEELKELDEERKREMKELDEERKREMKELNEELKADAEGRKREMKERNEELKADAEGRKREMKELNEEMKNLMKELHED